MSIKLDTIGWDCPLPLLELKKALKTIEKGEQIELTFSCPEAVVDIPGFCEEAGHEVLEYEKYGNKGWRIVVRK